MVYETLPKETRVRLVVVITTVVAILLVGMRFFLFHPEQNDQEVRAVQKDFQDFYTTILSNAQSFFK